MIIRGDGVAAYCCAYLLNKAGFRVDLERVDRPRLPVILLPDHALSLIRDIFDRPDLFAEAPKIRRRVVAWGSALGPGAAPLELEHSAILVSEEQLLGALKPAFDSEAMREIDWEIFATRPLPEPSVEHSFGTRMASAVPVELKPGSDGSTCWIESLDSGWLFLTPGWLLAVGSPPEALLRESRVVASEIANCGPTRGAFPAFARIVSPLCAPGWLACGTAAIAFDPICGDGTANAIREAILASAVVRGIADGGACDGLLSHYQARLTAGFQRHLAVCRKFYQSGGTSPLWRSELEAIDRGLEWCAAALAEQTTFRYRLRGFELEAAR